MTALRLRPRVGMLAVAMLLVPAIARAGFGTGEGFVTP
jgi:hypothetical protein